MGPGKVCSNIAITGSTAGFRFSRIRLPLRIGVVDGLTVNIEEIGDMQDTRLGRFFAARVIAGFISNEIRNGPDVLLCSSRWTFLKKYARALHEGVGDVGIIPGIYAADALAAGLPD
ncbi:MAG: hypothetical protein VR65_11165 [Desulfobulbaceae bacterium BRH_c16a]|nr:MAG: hypothetical protein VR65_11165 [Desulfobulbaceae bacterium BRH_c16a]